MDDVEGLPGVPLVDDHLARRGSLTEHRVRDLGTLVSVQVAAGSSGGQRDYHHLPTHHYPLPEEQVGVEHPGQGLPRPPVLRD